MLEEPRIRLSKGVPFELEWRLSRKSSKYRWNLTQYNPLKDEAGEIVCWYVSIN